MNRNLSVIFFTAILALGAHAADTGVWDTQNNTVTYSATANNIVLGPGGTVNIALSQFDTATAASEAGGDAGDFSLLYAVITLDGSIQGTIDYFNNSANTTNPKLYIFGSSQLTYGAYTAGPESYATVNLGSVAPGGSLVGHAINSPGTLGSVSTPDITADLQQFLGSGTIVTVADFTEVDPALTIGNDQSGSINLLGFAEVSVTYYYEQVPEPTSLSLLWLGCAVLALRRPGRKTTRHTV